MCGRYTIETDESLYERFSIENRLEFSSSYNAAPGQYLPVITRNSPNALHLMRWGLIPSWAKDPNIGYRMINARSETVTEKPSYRSAFKKRRCLVPASGFYEWQKVGGEKHPFYFSTGDYFAFAGLYEVNEQLESEPIYSYTILTTKPNEVISGIHHRMPVILNPADEDIWLDPESSEDELLNMLLPYQGALHVHEVSQAVNKPSVNSEVLIQPINSDESPE